MHERSQTLSSILLILLEIASIVLYGVFTEYHKDGDILNTGSNSNNIYLLYGPFQDIHVMMFIGFGFLMTFLKKFWFSSLGINFWLAALVLQWHPLVNGFWERLLNNEWHEKIHIHINSFILGDFAAASVLICYGALLGKATFNQMTIVALLQVIFFSLNENIAIYFLKITDIGGSMIIHTFGAYFGLAVSYCITDKRTLKKCFEIQGSNYNSDLFSMIGTIFLWMYWPSFNGALALADARERTIANTILALTNSCLFAFMFSRLVNSEEKFDMIHIQNSTLAGGVAIGAVANLPVTIFGSMIIGAFAGIISVLGFKYLQPFLEHKIGLHDSCGVNNLHGMPGILGGIVSGIAAAKSSEDLYGLNLGAIFPERLNDRSEVDQGAWQILCLVQTIGIAILGGLFTGMVLKIFTQNTNEYFQDVIYWEGAEGYIPIRKKNEVTEDEQKLEEKANEGGAALVRHHRPSVLMGVFQEMQKMSPRKLRSDPMFNKMPASKQDQALKAIQEMMVVGTNILSPKLRDSPTLKGEVELMSPGGEPKKQVVPGGVEMIGIPQNSNRF